MRLAMTQVDRVDIDAILLPDYHAQVVTHKMRVEERLRIQNAELDKDTAPVEHKWAQKHEQRGLAVSRTNWNSDLHAHLYPEYVVLATRCKELLDKYNVSFVEEECRVLNCSQTDISGARGGEFPTVTPAGTFWVTSKGRTAIGLELMRAMGIWVPDTICDTFSQLELQDLAGNAFATPNALPALYVLITTLGHFCGYNQQQHHCSEPAGPAAAAAPVPMRIKRQRMYPSEAAVAPLPSGQQNEKRKADKGLVDWLALMDADE